MELFEYLHFLIMVNDDKIWPSAERPIMETVHRLRTRMDLEQLKMPLGFIRIMEMIFALIAYVSLNSWEFDLSITCNPGAKVMNFTMQSLSLHQMKITRCDGSVMTLFPGSYGSGVNFFGFLAVVSLFFTVSAILVYSFWWSNYVSDDRLPMIDLVIVVVLAFGWLISTFTFSTSAGQVEDVTQKENVGKLLKKTDYCQGATSCTFNCFAMYQPLTVAMVAGMGCLLLFAANIWFTYKETANFRARSTRNIQIQQDPYTLE